MNISDNGLSLIEQFESLKFKAYKDIRGILTIGYGHTGSDVTDGLIISKNQAEILLKNDAQVTVQTINRLVKVVLNQNQFDALCSFIFNVGSGNFASSTMLKLINQSNFTDAANEFPKWDKAAGTIVQGLLNRRLKEQELFNSP